MKSLFTKCVGYDGLQFHQNFEPSTEHRAIAWSTNERGISATSSSRHPAAVMPWMTSCDCSELAPNSQYVFVPTFTYPSPRW